MENQTKSFTVKMKKKVFKEESDSKALRKRISGRSNLGEGTSAKRHQKSYYREIRLWTRRWGGDHESPLSCRWELRLCTPCQTLNAGTHQRLEGKSKAGRPWSNNPALRKPRSISRKAWAPSTEILRWEGRKPSHEVEAAGKRIPTALAEAIGNLCFSFSALQDSCFKKGQGRSHILFRIFGTNRVCQRG